MRSQKSSSDLHFISGDPPRVRVHGSLTLLNEEKLTIDGVREALYEIMSGTMQRDFEDNTTPLTSPTTYPKYRDSVST